MPSASKNSTFEKQLLMDYWALGETDQQTDTKYDETGAACHELGVAKSIKS